MRYDDNTNIILSQILLKGGDLMKYEDYVHIYNDFARLVGLYPIQRSDAPHEKGKIYIPAKIKTFPFKLSVGK